MLSTVLVALLLGILLGTITGLLPGLHSNLVAVLLLTAYYQYTMSLAFFSILLISAAITHTFVDSIPAIFLGVPEASLSLLPSQKLVHKGEGYYAIFLTTVGSLGGVVAIVLAVPTLLYAFNYYQHISSFIPLILSIILLSMLLAKKTWYTLIIIALSGSIGLILLNNPIKEPLFLLFTGLFGVSSLLIALKSSEKIPPQSKKKISIPTSTTLMSLSIGTLTATVFSILPGVGAAHAATVAHTISKNLNKYAYLIIVGSINTITAISSLIFLYTNNKARAGYIVTLSQVITLEQKTLWTFILLIVIVGGIASIITLGLGRLSARIAPSLPARWLNTGLIMFLLIITYTLTGSIGILALLITTSIGVLCQLLRVRKSSMMACLIVPLLVSFW